MDIKDINLKFITDKESIHVLTVATFDVTKWSKMEQIDQKNNRWGLEFEPAIDFEVRLPYTIDGVNWKKKIVNDAQKFMVQVTKERPDIGFVSLLPDQVRAILTDWHGNGWGKKFLSEFGEERIKSLLLATEEYIGAFSEGEEIELSGLPDPLKREHLRTKEDIEAIAQAIERRKHYENRRRDSI